MPKISSHCSFFSAGWCSAAPGLTFEKYGFRVQELKKGDICLPPTHPDAVRTPDLCDRFRRFEFGDDIIKSPGLLPQSPGFCLTPQTPTTPFGHALNKSSPPPSSPAKIERSGSKKSGGGSSSTTGEEKCDKPKRPMNGFMLFAKKYRLELIQQHPGKDNR